MKKLKDLVSGIPPHAEVLVRVTLASFCGFCLSVGSPSSAVPSHLGYLIGIIAATLAVSIPTLIFGIGAVFPNLMIAIIMAMAGSSMLLAAATVSSGLMVFIFAVYTLWMCGLRYGPTKSKTNSYTSILIVIAAMLALSFRTLVQDGFSIALPPAGEDSILIPFLQQALETYCVNQGLPVDCWKEDPSTNSTNSIQFVVPGSGNLAGQTAEIIVDQNGETSLHLTGGLWIVAGLWKWTGLDNPLAVNRNFLICICWSMACVVVVVLLPPFRTARSAISRGLLPSVLAEVQASLVADDSVKVEETNEDKSKEENDKETKEEPNSDKADNSKKKGQRVGKLIHYMNTLETGIPQKLIAFEPRLVTAPFECSWPVLKAITKQSFALAYAAIAVVEWSPSMTADPNVQEAMENAANVISKCAKALQTNENPSSSSSSLKDLVEEKSTENDEENPDENDATTSIVDQSNRFLTVSSQALLQATLAWLTAVHHPDSPWPCTKKGFENVTKTYGLWFLGMVPVVKRLLELLTMPFRPKLWNFASLIMAIKWTLGFVALFVMSIYWEGYNNFAFDLDNPGVNGLYSGWNLMAYAFCWQGTLEGSVKNGIARALGTALGGFSAWLAIIVCSGSYDANADINPYGLVAWLTITTGIAAHFTVGRGASARFGTDPDHGAVGLYFISTQALCALEIEAGSGDRDDIVVNRIVATLSGVAMCMVFSLIPPYVCGGDPKHARALLTEVQSTLACSLKILLSEKDSVETKMSELKQLQTNFTKVGSEKRGDALFLFKDASHLEKLPFLKVDPSLKTEIEKISVTGCLVLSFMTFAEYICENKKMDEVFHQSDKYRQQLESSYNSLTSADDNSKKQPETADMEDEEEDMQELETPDEYLAAIMRLLNFIIRRIETHEASLSTIKVDWFGKH